MKFSRKNREKLIESLMYFFTSLLDFLNMVTLTKHRILRYESYFFIFVFSCFCQKSLGKKTSKMQRAICVPKTAHEWRPGTHSESKIVPNLREKGQKSLKLTELPDSPDDPPSEIFRERSSERKAPRNAPPTGSIIIRYPEPSSCNYPMDNNLSELGSP